MKTINLVIRLLFALIYLVFGLNGLFNFFPLPEVPEKAGIFMGALYGSGYLMYLVKITEIATAVLLIFNRFSALSLVVIFPITLNIFLFNLFLAPAGLPVGIFLLAANIYLMFVHLKAYKPMLKA
jgi:putative oxidoreductase